MTVNLGSITTGLGNLTPEVWSALGETVQKVRDLEQRFERAEQLAVNPPMFLAKITGYQRVSPISSEGPDDEGSISNPKNVYLYDFEEVTLIYKPGVTGDEDPALTEVVSPKTFQGKRTNVTLGVKAVNLAEFGQPTTRTASFGGIMLAANQYPQVSTVPTIHGSDTNAAGTIEPSGSGTGPIVVMHLVEGQDAEQFKYDEETGEKVEPEEIEENEGQKPIIPVFYSAINMDGACGE
jgi:hypothetical protein